MKSFYILAICLSLTACAERSNIDESVGLGEYAIYSLVIDSIYKKPQWPSVVEARCVVVNDSTIQGEKYQIVSRSKLVSDRDSLNFLFNRLNQKKYVLEQRFSASIGVKFANLNEYFKKPINLPAKWEEFYSKFPGANGIISFSRIAMSDNHAMLYCEIWCGRTCGGGFFVYLDRIGGKWAIVSQVETWVS